MQCSIKCIFQNFKIPNQIITKSVVPRWVNLKKCWFLKVQSKVKLIKELEFIPVNFTAHNRHTWLSFAKRVRILSIKVRRWERSKKVAISKFQFGISRRHLEFEQNWASLFLLGQRSTNSESLRKIGLLGLKGLKKRFYQ